MSRVQTEFMSSVYRFLPAIILLGLVGIFLAGCSSGGNGNSAENGEDFDVINSVGMGFVYVEPGEFMMGSPEDEPGRRDDENQHQVALTLGYYIQTTQVTQGQWKAVMGTTPSTFSECGDDCPVESITWDDVQAFIMTLNEIEDTVHYALPTEAQWEYAARAGTTTAFANGPITETGMDYDPVLDDIAWYAYNSDRMRHPVAKKEPNFWGLYDMHGNVWEWVEDWYGEYPEQAVVDPEGPSSGSDKVIRGGGCNDPAQNCRAATRSSAPPGSRFTDLGFRVVLLE